MKKKILALCVVVCMLAVAVVSGTLAYFTDVKEKDNEFVLGDVEIEITEDFVDNSEILPDVEIEKIVSVTNTGISDAYTRVILTFPAHVNPVWSQYVGENGPWTIAKTESSDTQTVYTLHYADIIAKDVATYPCLEAVYIDKFATEEDFTGLVENGKIKVNVKAEAIQAAGFANAEEAMKALDNQAVVDGAGTSDTTISAPTDDTMTDEAKQDAVNNAFEAAVTENKGVIKVTLDADVTYDVTAWNAEAMGGTSTKEIVIDGNGHTITFNHINSDWNNIVTNGATLVIKNAKITNSGYNDGPWNRHNLNFGCDVVLENVTSDKALALKEGATLKNVTISDANTDDTYAIWIQPKGQTIDIDGLTVDMIECKDGRGIKIDNLYLNDAEAGVTLNVKNATFKTEEKSAILVKSTKTVNIALENIDISGVADDSVNEVWVDEATAGNDANIHVTGGNKIVEP